ncbi:expressed unknown protein [Seminavis robusta]|uniref:EGF-like domain-containing protein n=1 Tax=Seminavis robusta TaxID=568900 RepID=A0A9N8DBY7_9STRA|nr:expressed unknown protein [Seminavis robusta]|eukprot:Sro28_g018690.1 n/a (741) ;mRNA; r:62700-72252
MSTVARQRRKVPTEDASATGSAGKEQLESLKVSVSNVDNGLLVEPPEEDVEELDKGLDKAAAGSPDRRLEKGLTEDIYSLMYTSHKFSAAFFFAWAAFAVQFTILILIFGDLVDLSDDPQVSSNGETNRLKIPAGIETHVQVAQFLSVILTINFTAAGGDMFKGLQHLFNGFDRDLERKHPGANAPKWFVAGVLQVLVGVLMVVNLFILAMQSSGVIGLCLNFAALHFVQEIDDVAFTVASMGLLGLTVQKEVQCVGDIVISAEVRSRTLWMRRIVWIVLVVGLYSCWFVIASWQWSGKFVCDVVLVQFGDAYDADLAFFSGPFRTNGTQNSRDKYVDESGLLKLRYSSTVKVSTDAPPDRGTCNDKHDCVCFDEFIGDNCESSTPTCGWYGIDFRTRGTLANIPGGSFFFDNEFSGINSTRICGRFLYLPYNFDGDDRDTRLRTFMFFTGRRWVIMGAPYEAELPYLSEFYDFIDTSRVLELPPIEGLRLLADNRIFRPLYFSSPVDLGTPSYGFEPSTVTWVLARKHKKAHQSPFFGYWPDDATKLDVQLQCSECSNKTEDGKATCQNDGSCDEHGYCKCLPFYAGLQCEYVYACNELGCFNGGTCNEITGHCQKCRRGAHGNLCQFPLPAKVKENPYFCSTTYDSLSSCRNGQKCDPFELKCECEPPFYGEFCQNSTQADCFLAADDTFDDFVDPCRNGGYCDQSLFHPICLCPEGFSGDFCEVPVPVTNSSGKQIG